MKFRVGKRLLFFILAFTALYVSAQDEKVPASVGYVNDFAGIINSADVQAINSKLKAFDDSTSTQIAVVIENGLKGKTPFDRAMEYARGWGVGSKEKNNGVVLYVAISDDKDDRGYFTVTSQATQGVLTDAVIGEIQRDYLVPNFRNKNYAAGIDATVTAYMQALKGEFKAGAKKGKDRLPGWVIILVIFGIIFFIGLFNNSRNGRGYRSGGAYWFPGSFGGGGSGGGSDSGGGWGGFGGGGGFDGGGAGGSW